jgi:DNA invertase Pin-like site-specific DNA recombinase
VLRAGVDGRPESRPQAHGADRLRRDELGADRADIETDRDKSAGTNTGRSGYRDLMADVDAADADVDAVVGWEISRMARSLQDGSALSSE